MIEMNNNLTQGEVKTYLEKHGISKYKEKGKELAFPCPFNSCDDDHRGGEEFHCNINTANGTYYCFKCGEKGNFVTLQKYFGDYEKSKRQAKRKKSLTEVAKDCHTNLPEQYREYFNSREIKNESIDRFMLGYGEFYGKFWLTIPVFSDATTVAYLKLRKLPEDNDNKTKYIVYPKSSKIALVGLYELQQSSSNDVLICEGELDRIVAIQNGASIPVVTCGGAMVFKESWCELYLKHMRNIYICLDRDEAGQKATERLVEIIKRIIPNASIFNIKLPDEFGEHGDITNYFNAYGGNTNTLIEKYTQHIGGMQPIDITNQQEMTVDELAKVLNLTIKHDFDNKCITFLGMLLTYTENDQLNIMFNAASSTGKTYICSEVAKYFPANDVKMYGKTTPTAFYYNESLSKADEETSEKYIDLERKILVFTEQPDTKLLENLRAFLSHDNKRTPFAITNKGKNGANSAKEGYILGFSSTFFCTANMRMDEQEQTRSLILSPENNLEKIEAGIDNNLTRLSDEDSYDEHIKGEKMRQDLIDRIIYIKQQCVARIKLQDKDYIRQKFMESQHILQPRSQRDVQHFVSLVKAMALLNIMFRTNENGEIIATNSDVDQAHKLWKTLDESRLYGVPPQLFDIYKRLIIPAYVEKNNGMSNIEDGQGITFKEFTKFHFSKTGSAPNIEMYKRNYLPILEGASLISYAKPENGDKRNLLITPLILPDEPNNTTIDDNYSNDDSEIEIPF